MRYLVLSLILLNLGWMAWYFWIYEPPAANVVEDDAPSLTLAKEANREPMLPELEATEDNQVASVDLDTGAVTVPPEPEPAPETPDETPPTEEAVGSVSGGAEELVAEFEAEMEPVAEGPVGALVEEPGESEAPPEPELVVAAVEEVVQEAPPLPARCVTLGPFSEQGDAQGAVAKLDDAGYTASRRELTQSVKSGTSVYLSGYATRSEASQVVSSLKQQGVRDLMLMPGGDTPLISLGFFRNPQLAKQRRQEIRRLGHQAELQDRFRDTTAYWLDFEIPADEEFSTANYGTGLELNDCP